MDRFSHHWNLKQVGKLGQRKIADSHVAVVGAGGLGSSALFYLAAAGIGKLTIIDGDQVDLSNLQRQVLYRECDVGLSKAEKAKQRLAELNSEIEICVHTTRIGPENIYQLLDDCVHVIDATDNLATKYLLNDYCVLENKSLVLAAISEFSAQLMQVCPRSGCYRCVFPESTETNALANCSTVGVIGALPGIIGSWQALESIKNIIGAPTVNQLIQFEFFDWSFSKIEFGKDPDCVVCGDRPAIKEISRSSAIPADRWIEVDEIESDFVLVDVRTEQEFLSGSLPSAVNCPLQSFDFTWKPDLSYLVFCQTGARCEALWRQQRLISEQVYFLKGGIDSFGSLNKKFPLET